MMTHTCPYCGKGFEHNGRGKPRKTCGSEGCKKANKRACQRAYEQTEERKANQRAYRQTEKCKAYQRAYQQTEEYKACKRERQRQIRNAATINEIFRIITQAQENRP